MKYNMRKFVMIAVLLMGVGACAYAIDFSEYKSPFMKSCVYSAQQRSNMPYTPFTPYTPYNVSSLGGGSTTWDNNGGSNDGNNGGFGSGDNGNGGGGYYPSRPRRALSVDGNGNLVGSPDVTWEYNGVTYGYDDNGNVYFWDDRDGEWTQLGGVNPGDIGAPFSPVGSPVLPFLLFAMMACGVIYYRRRSHASA